MDKKYFYFFLLLIFFVVLVFIFQQHNTNPLNLGQTENNFSPFLDDSISTTPEVFFCPEDNCKEILLALINNSKQKIDCAIYDISSKDIADAFISKHQEGINIRIVTDNERSTTKTSQIGNLKFFNLDILVSPFKNSYMHNKFCIFDENTVLLGSSNFTENSFFESYNNILIFNDHKLANILTKKIDSFYFGNFSKDTTILEEELYSNFSIIFCPSSNCEKIVLDEIKKANQSIECMLYSFTLDSFSEQLILAKQKGTDVKIILENQQNSIYSEYDVLKANNIEVILDNQSFLMHHKFCIFDNTTLITGSMNFSNNGINKNDEFFIQLIDPKISLIYKNYFENKWNEWFFAN